VPWAAVRQRDAGGDQDREMGKDQFKKGDTGESRGMIKERRRGDKRGGGGGMQPIL